MSDVTTGGCTIRSSPSYCSTVGIFRSFRGTVCRTNAIRHAVTG
jgi:hypothetical protein